MGPIRRTALFAAGAVMGLLSIATGSAFGWITGIALIAGAFFIVRRWWLPRERR
jgi:hypothetical protein